MWKIKIEQIAREQGFTLASLGKATGLSRMSIRKLWYSSRSGYKKDAGTLRKLNLDHLESIAGCLGVNSSDLMG
ncbi:MAG: helix-turn-helix transcriptional regulator [Kouleothrix sp.]|nr:helix-turn-helix transcriptional regulator [Kouleothrix sp.]